MEIVNSVLPLVCGGFFPMVIAHVIHNHLRIYERNLMRLYLAAPLFTEAERKYNIYLCGLLENAGYNVFLPQREVSQYEGSHKPSRIYNADLAGLRNSDCVVAICDGADVDSGTAWECGYACSRGIPVI